MSLPTWPSWQQAMETFIDRTVDGFLPVAPEVTKGNPISRVKWVYTYATNAEGDLVYKARLVWAHNAGTQPGGSEFEQNTMSNVAKALHWKTLIHTALVDGANITRLDISNAHQSSRRGPTGDTRATTNTKPRTVPSRGWWGSMQNTSQRSVVPARFPLTTA